MNIHDKASLGYYNKAAFLFIITIIVLMSALVYFNVQHTNNTLTISQKIYAVLDTYRITYDIDLRGVDQTVDTTPQTAQGIEHCIHNIAYFVATDRPINMLLVGFPFKSGNREKKVLGYLPDMAERKSLEYLQQMLNEIRAVYSPGAKILIFCDGIPFAEFFGIPLADVVAYEQELKKLSADLPDITLSTSEDMMKKHNVTSLTEIIHLMDHYPPSDEQFRAELKEIPAVALKRFALELDHPQGRMLLEKNTLQEIAIRMLAREMRLRSYIMKNFPTPEFFRLTVHLSTDVSKKFGIRLSPTSDITPYHGVMVQDGLTWSIRSKKDIDENHYVYDNMLINGNKYGYYKHKTKE